MRLIALRLDIVDRPHERKIHDNATPLLGGVAIVIAFTASFISNMILERGIAILLCGGAVVAFVGVLDDWKGVPASLKLLVQVFVVLGLVYHGIMLDLFPVRTTWGFWLNLIFTIMGILAKSYLYHYLDCGHYERHEFF